MQVNITSISQTATDIITLVANVIYDGETTINISSFSFNIDGTGVTPTSKSPSSGSYDENFTLTLTFSRSGFGDLFTNGLLSTYAIYYDGTNMAETQFTYGFEILNVEFTLTDNEIITAAADITYYETPVIVSNFTYNLTYSGGSYTNATPSSQSPADGTTQTGNFTLTLTFSIGDFPNVLVDGRTTTYNFLYDGYSVAQFSYAPTFIFPTFSFTSFTVQQMNYNEIDVESTYSFTNMESAPTASSFTYTVVIGATTHTYDSNTPNFTPLVQSGYYTFTFGSADFPELFVNGELQTHTLNFQAYGLNVTTDPPVQIIYSNTVSLTFTAISLQLEAGNLNNVEASFSFTYTNFEYGPPSQTNKFYYVLNGTLLNNNIITWNISENAIGNSGTGTGTARFARQSDIFIQAASITHLVRYVDGAEVGPFDSSTVTTVFTLSDSNNVTITKPVTIVTISANKSIILPPVGTSKGTLYHFKILTATNPNTLKIFPLVVLSPPIPPLVTKLYTTSLTYDSVIEGVAGPITFNSTTTRNTLTLISDGANWSILNKYTDTLTIGALTGAPTNTLSETTQTKSFQYTYVNSEGDYYTKILLNSTAFSYLKYIFITNADSASLVFTIYVPIAKAFETLPVNESRYNYFTFTIPAGKIAGIILTYLNNTYYIISASINPSISTSGTTSETPTIISSTVSLLQSQPAYEIPYYLPNFDSSISQLLILKSATTPTVQGETNVLFRLTKDPVSLFSLDVGAAVWFIGYQFDETRQHYLPVSYYVPPA